MSVEEDYNESASDCELLLSLIQGLAVHIDWHIQKIKTTICTRYGDNDFDIEYVNLHLEDINKDVQEVLFDKLKSIKGLIKEKHGDLDD